MNQIAIDDPRQLPEFHQGNPLFTTATKQAPSMIPWYAFPGASSVRVAQAMVDNIARVVEQRVAPEQVRPEMAAEVRRLLPRRAT